MYDSYTLSLVHNFGSIRTYVFLRANILLDIMFNMLLSWQHSKSVAKPQSAGTTPIMKIQTTLQQVCQHYGIKDP